MNLAILVRVASAVIGKSYDSNYVSKATLNDMGKNDLHKTTEPKCMHWLFLGLYQLSRKTSYLPINKMYFEFQSDRPIQNPYIAASRRGESCW